MSGPLSDQELYDLSEVLDALLDQIHYQHTALVAIAHKAGVGYDFDGPGMAEYIRELRQKMRTALRSNLELEGEGEEALVHRQRED